MKFLIRNSKFLILSIIILAAVFGPLGAHLAQAGLVSDLLGIGDIASSVIKKIFAWIGYLILKLISLILALAGLLLDTSIDYSINKFAETSKEIVKTGWTISRDIANLFFIFILLYIAIATILQLSGYGMKELLAKVIIIALLVNFSLMITGFIIDASNILAMEFYNKIAKIPVEGGEPGKTVGPSTALTSAFEPMSLFDTKKTEEGDIPIFKPGDDKGEVTLVNIFIITIMGSIFFLVLAFVFFAAAILFIIRTVILWLLMILSPLAFLAMALPATQQYASKWWKKLFDQALFAPVYLFLLYLVIFIVTSGAITKGLGTENATLSGAFLKPGPGPNINLILKFVAMIILSIAALLIAKDMGAYGSSTVMGWGKKMKGAAQGYAGKITKRGAARATGSLAEGVLKSEHPFALGLKSIPGVTRGLAATSGWKQKELEKQKKEYEKGYGSYSEAGLQAMLNGPRLTSAKREAIQGVLAKKRGKTVAKEKVKEENKEYEKIDKELPQMEKWSEQDEKRTADIDAELGGLHGDKSAEAFQRRKQLNLERKQAEKRIKEVEQMKKRKAEIEEKRERRAEQEGLEERLGGKIEASKGGKPPPATAAKP